MQRKTQVGVGARGCILGGSHHVHAPGNTQAALLAIEGSDTVSVREVHDRQAFLGSLGINVDGEMLAAKSGESSFLNAAGDFLERVGAADGADEFVEELIGRRKDGSGLAGPGAF